MSCMSFEKSQTNKYCAVPLVSLQEIWKIRMRNIHPLFHITDSLEYEKSDVILMYRNRS